ncbi:methyltransferase [Saccharophagus sp. K07]|jgi:predicted nicotinamide N-methyase|uniref:class I SAM-dependent methyltransferase n=1 Tax=Saccharophagus sp. K07 TaxID=2283636 RepID=UPI0016521C6A|nr:class I SAM-dependent methyltransferase [Saccharophagus sp. K07]
MMNSPHVRSIHGIRILKHKHQVIKRLKKESPQPTLYGDQVWHSSFLLMDYFKQHPLPERQRIMDIGCGWGLLGIYCAKHFNSDIVSVDADSGVFPYVHSHEELNEVSVKTEQASFDQLKVDDFAQQDMVIGADICFWPSMVRELKTLIAKAIRAGVKKIILADPGRSTFLQLAEHCKENYITRLEPWQSAEQTTSKGMLLIIENPQAS